MKPFNLEAFKAGQKALTRDGRVATFVGICEECSEIHYLIIHIEGEKCTSSIQKSGTLFKTATSALDLVSMVSRHQHLIDSYDPEDTWQVRSFDRRINDDFETVYSKPSFDETFEYRLHPHNDLIKAWKKGAKIELSRDGIKWEDSEEPAWSEEWHYRIKPEPEFTYPIYKQIMSNGLVVKFSSLTTGDVINKGKSNHEVGETIFNLKPHTVTSVWEEWTPTTKTVPEPIIHCLCYNPDHVHGEFSWSPSIATKQLAVANGWYIIQEWEV